MAEELGSCEMGKVVPEMGVEIEEELAGRGSEGNRRRTEEVRECKEAAAGRSKREGHSAWWT